MSSLAPRALDPNADVLVSPGYLAGPGDSHSIFNTLDRAPSWTKTVAFGTDTYFTSPCQRVRVANPVESFYGGWTISYAEDPLGVPDWITTFDRNTPHEIVAEFTKTRVQRRGRPRRVPCGSRHRKRLLTSIVRPSPSPFNQP
ncbi:DUF317 domain-containing protein [Streptomyces sp. NPDC001815]|uniref:DUF317 domain-containing protein n=1 Tax=Streptomyces sp. NPDC001815 TaxID=3154526 RepID=UPI00331E2DA4